MAEIQYQVIQIDESSYSGREIITLKGVFSNYNKADRYAKNLYNDSINYYKSTGAYDEISSGKYIEKDTTGQEIISKYIVNEIEFEIDEPCEIELS